MTVQQALEHANFPDSDVTYLGEGAWHQAWKLTSTQHEPLVLRIPKKIAYKKQVTYDESALKAEYGATEVYYRYINQVSPGAAPASFQYHVTQELTYTVESFAGKNVNLHRLNSEEACNIGGKLGILYRNLEQVNHNLKGFGYFAWNEKEGVHGQFSSDYHTFIKEECIEVMDDYEELSTKRPTFMSSELKNALLRICERRMLEIKQPVLTNQDASPENWLLDSGQVRLIDPLPILYFGEVMAGNFMNLYETLFVELAHTERYRKQRFHKSQENLQSIADGFLTGYCNGNSHSIRVLKGEQLLQVLDTAIRHLRMLESGLTAEQIIRYGSSEDVEYRLTAFAKKINELMQLV